MNSRARPRTHRSLALLIALSLGMLAVTGPTTSAAPICPGGVLAEKSAAGLMPPACGLAPNAPAPAALAASVGFLGAPINTRVGSWAQLVVGADLNNDQVDEAAVGTAADFDTANDWQVHLLKQLGGPVGHIPHGPCPNTAWP